MVFALLWLHNRWLCALWLHQETYDVSAFGFHDVRIDHWFSVGSLLNPE